MVGRVETRIDKAFAVLSPRERAIHVLQALREERELEPQVRSAMPWWQREEYDHYVSLLRAANMHLAYYVIILERQTGSLRDKLGWWLTAKAWEMKTCSKRHKGMPTAKETAKTIEDNLRGAIGYRWRQLMAVEAALLSMAEQFEGEDPLRPFLRDLLNEARATVEDLKQHVECISGRRLTLPEPSSEEADAVVDFLLQAKKLRA